MARSAPGSDVGRLILVSNRLPVTVRVDGAEVTVTRSPGGLANGLAGPHARLGGVWVGWPGDVSRLDVDGRAALEARLRELHAVPVHLGASEVARYYEGFSNGVLWPLFHYLLDRMPLDARDYDAYVRVNQRFADVTAAQVQPGDAVWVHDYQLALVPRMLRARVPADVRIGFFLHIPFPAAEVTRTLPWRRDLLEGMLGADLVGFHTDTYLRHFVESCGLLLAARADGDVVRHGGVATRVGVFPMGVDARAIRALAASESVEAEAASLRTGEQLLLGIDRLDYTKGIPRRLVAFERLLEREASLRGRVRLVQVAVPSREKVPAYRELRRLVEELVGRINGTWGTATWAPVHYVHRSMPEAQVIAHYRAADVMVVTPLRDGMNLVAKEFVAARGDGGGVLVLSELAGAAEELDAALKVNPYDIERTAAALSRALRMPPAERSARMRSLHARVCDYDVHAWADAFVAALGAPPAARAPPTGAEEAARAALGARPHAVFFLDYDGTLVPFALDPADAAPDPALLRLLERLARRPETELVLVSGRRREDLDAWFGGLPIALVAEHGLWRRWRGAPGWERVETGDLGWVELAVGAMEALAGRRPGTRVERKTAGAAFHWRGMPAAEVDVRDLRHHLHELARWMPLDVVEGSCVLEVRARGVHKGRAVEALREAGRLADAAVIAFGDDHTDEDLFAALPPDAVSVLVGERPSQARWRVARPEDARALLESLAG
jgi:trehalose 6-phosphate synthase/phosphatase